MKLVFNSSKRPLSDKANPDPDHAEPIDLVRTSLIDLAKDFYVTNDNGSLSLNFSFAGSTKI